MARGFRFELDPGFEAQVLRSSDTRELLRPLTEEARDRAERHAARRKGYLVEGITAEVVVESGDRGPGFSGAGYVGRVVSHDFKSVWLEYGTRRTRAQPFLVPALAETLPGAPIHRR